MKTVLRPSYEEAALPVGKAGDARGGAGREESGQDSQQQGGGEHEGELPQGPCPEPDARGCHVQRPDQSRWHRSGDRRQVEERRDAEEERDAKPTTRSGIHELAHEEVERDRCERNHRHALVCMGAVGPVDRRATEAERRQSSDPRPPADDERRQEEERDSQCPHEHARRDDDVDLVPSPSKRPRDTDCGHRRRPVERIARIHGKVWLPRRGRKRRAAHRMVELLPGDCRSDDRRVLEIVPRVRPGYERPQDRKRHDEDKRS